MRLAGIVWQLAGQHRPHGAGLLAGFGKPRQLMLLSLTL